MTDDAKDRYNLTGLDALEFGVDDLATCRRFFTDWGLSEQGADDERLQFRTLDGGEIIARPIDAPELPPAFEDGSTVRRAIWGLASQSDLERLTDALSGSSDLAVEDGLPSLTDPAGLRVSFRVTTRDDAAAKGAVMNTYDQPSARRDERAPVYDHATPARIGHLVLFVPDIAASVAFYTEKLGFHVSDYYPDFGYFLRCRAVGGHHDLFMLQTPDGKTGLNHVAFTVRDIHEVFGGGLHISRCGWSTQIGPGRHPISSAYFWYVASPAGGQFEYFADEDWCTADWQAKAWERKPEHFAEWAIDGGIDGESRRQAS